MGSYFSGPASPASWQIALLSLGMLALDKLRFPNRETLYNIPGGLGLYSKEMVSSIRLLTNPDLDRLPWRTHFPVAAPTGDDRMCSSGSE